MFLGIIDPIVRYTHHFGLPYSHAKVSCSQFAIASFVLFPHQQTRRRMNLPLLFKEDFENGFTRWQTTDPKGADPSWKIIDVEPKAIMRFDVWERASTSRSIAARSTSRC